MSPLFAVSDSVAAAGLVAGVLAPVLSYYAATRRMSGKIETSEAKDLWNESRSIRELLQHRVEALTNEVERLERRLRTLEEHNAGLLDTIREQRMEVERLHAELREAEAKLAVSVQQVAIKESEVAALEARCKLAETQVAQLETEVDTEATIEPEMTEGTE